MLVRVLVEFGWLERAPGARGRRRRAARALSELMHSKKVFVHVGSLVRLYHMNTPHRPREADFRSTAPFLRSGMRLFNGLALPTGISRVRPNFADFLIRVEKYLDTRLCGRWYLAVCCALENHFLG